MTKHRKDTDYLALSSRVRSMERHLLTAARAEQLLDAKAKMQALRQRFSEALNEE